MSKYFGHSPNKEEKWQTLIEHLNGVTRRLSDSLEGWYGQAEGRFAGLSHDLGKYPDSFQDRLRGIGSGLDHWSAGAYIACQKKLRAAAFCVYGHHVGLPCMGILRGKKSLADFGINHPQNLTLTTDDLGLIEERMREDGLELPDVPTPLLDGKRGPLESMLDVRRLFSALTDADFLDTEEHMQAQARPAGRGLDINLYRERLDMFMNELRQNTTAPALVREVREQVLAEASQAARRPPGLFTLAAPTGAGKTLAMLAFALEHAKCHGLRRVITVLPFLTLIEQTGKIYKSALKPDEGDLVEHHSLAHSGYDEGEDESRRLRRLTENWDAPLIITTSVQFLESLFAHKPSICRKLHRIAGSVILLDEVQTIPVNLAKYTIGALSCLVKNWGCTVLMATATQPAFEHLSSHMRSFRLPPWSPTPVVAEPGPIFEKLRRTRYEFLPAGEPITDMDLAERLKGERQALVVVNLKRQARSLYECLQRQGRPAFHLSTRNCPNHRFQILDQVRSRLAKGQEILLISTQCIEAGVDVDFPRLFRAYGPLDALVQAAGRCNREGLLDVGLVTVYEPTGATLPGQAYQQATQRTKALVKLWRSRDPDFDDPSDPDKIREYFESLYAIAELKKLELDTALEGYDFPAVREHYRLIDQDMINILVPYAKDLALYSQLKLEAEDRGISRAWIARARSITVSEFRPRDNLPIRAYLQPLTFQAGRGGVRAEVPDWFIYLEPSHYHPDLGLVPPTDMPDFVL